MTAMGEPARALDELRRPTASAARARTADATGLAVVSQRAATQALINPVRRTILQSLATPGSATTVAEAIGKPRQLVNYHLRVLERAGLVEEVGQRPRRGLTERIVRATAAHYLVAPDAIAQLSGSPAETGDRFSATYQVAVAARTIREVAALASLARQAGKRLTTLNLDTEVCFASPADREAFANELVTSVNQVVAKYHRAHARHGRPYRLFMGAHPVYQPEAAPASPPRHTAAARRPRTRKRVRT